MIDRDDNFFNNSLHLSDFNHDGYVDFIDYTIYDDILSDDVQGPTHPFHDYDDDYDEYDDEYDDVLCDDIDDDEHRRYDYQDLLPDNICEAFEKGYIDEDDLLYEVSNWYTDVGSVEDNCESIFVGSTYIDFDSCTKGLYDYLSDNLSIELESYGERILLEHADDNNENYYIDDEDEDEQESTEYEHDSRLDDLLDYDDVTFGFIDSSKKESYIDSSTNSSPSKSNYKSTSVIISEEDTSEESTDMDTDADSEIESEMTKANTEGDDKKFTYDINDPSSFIVRNRLKERSLGIKDIMLHCCWLDSSLFINGEIIADAITEPFYLECRRYDDDGDLYDYQLNFSYTGGSGFSIHKIMPGSFFNRYPFVFSISYDENKLTEKIHLIPIKNEDEKEEDYDNTSLATIDVNNILTNPPISNAVDVYRMEKNDKIPKEKIYYYIEKGIGLNSIKCCYIKSSDSDHWYRHAFNYTQILDGSVKIRGLIYHLVYNDKGQLISCNVDDLYPHNYVDDCGKGIITISYDGSKIGKVIVYVGFHPSIFLDNPPEKRELERALKGF